MKLMRANKQGGFSLVEVTLAVAIAAVAMITFLGLLPLGLETSRKTSIKMANSAILEQVIQNIDGMLWTNVPKKGTPTYLYFNEELTQVPANSSEMSYLVQVEYAGPANLSSGTQTYLQRVWIRIANTNSAGFAFPSAGAAGVPLNGTNYSTYSYLFAKTR